jgi:hypothetical protein
VVEQLPEHELVYGSEPVWERGKGEAVAKQQPPRASGYEAAVSSRGRRLGVVEASLPEKHQSPTWRAKYQSGFVTLPPELLQEQPAVVLLLEGDLVSWSLAVDERGGHEDLCDSGHQSIIPYIHRRTELYFSSLYEPETFLFPLSVHLSVHPSEVAPARAFYSSRSDIYNESRGPTGGPEVVETLYNS